MTKGIAAGPFADPVRYGGNKEYTERYGGAWERTISIFRCLYSFVAHVRPRGDPLVGELWYGHDAPHGTVYVPFFPLQDRTPPSYLEGVQSEFSQKSAWWAFNFVNNWAHLKFSFMQKELVDWRAPLEKVRGRGRGTWVGGPGASGLGVTSRCRAPVGGWQLATGGWWRLVVVGDWWLVAVGSWRLVAAGGWRRLVAVGGWWLVAVGG